MTLSQPLEGIHVVEFEGIGPGPLAGRMLAGMGATVTVIVRPEKAPRPEAATADHDPTRVGKRIVVLDLKRPDGVAQALDLIAKADALVEGNRPGVMERLGLGPAVCKAVNPRLVYGRMTGWGQQGPLAQAAGHDLNYIALTGLLSLAAAPGAMPRVPPTLVGDAVGALGLAWGIACALIGVRADGQGRVVDGAIVDVLAMVGLLVNWLRATGRYDGARPSGFYDSPYYDVYACADGRLISVGAIEPQFYALLLAKLGMDDVDPKAQGERAAWPALKARFIAHFKTRTQQQWCELLEGSDACFAPVLSMDEAARHPHNVARGVLESGAGGVAYPRISPRISGLVDTV